MTYHHATNTHHKYLHQHLCTVFQVMEVQHQTEEQRAWLLAEYPANRLYQLKRKCNGCQEQDLSLLEGELVALLEDTDPLGSSSRWLVHTGGKCLHTRERILATETTLLKKENKTKKQVVVCKGLEFF